MATITGDTYNADVTFNSSGQDVQVAYLGNNSFMGNITINSNKVVFNTSTGKVTFTGSNNQTLNGSYNYPFKKLSINKTSGTVTANTTLSVDDSLIFIQGNLITTSTNLLTMKHGSSATGASNTSFVSGPVKKIGNTAFSFPVGKQNGYLPLEISAPATTTSEFVAEYKLDTIDVHTIDRDASLGFVFRDRYWTLSRTSGTSNVYVTLSWNDSYHLEDSLITTCFWNGSMWKDQGSSNATGSDAFGTMRTTSTQSSFAEFTIGYKSFSALGSGRFDCQNIQNQQRLQLCLVTGDPLCQITTGFTLQESGGGNTAFFPLPVYPGVVVTGYNSATTSTPKWWEGGCPTLVSEHYGKFTTGVKSYHTFELYPGGTINNLRIRGPECSWKDYNAPDTLSGGIYVAEDLTASTAMVSNCEISCFSNSGIWKRTVALQLDVVNCYVHKTKGRSRRGIGYGIWTQGTENSVTTLNASNSIFDDCKTALDDQGLLVSWDINKCIFSQFFQSEDINRHDGKYARVTGVNTTDCHIALACPPNAANYFYGLAPGGLSSYQECNGIYSAYGTNWDQCLNYGGVSKVPIYDIGGAESSIQNCIFYNDRTIENENTNGNVNLTYPYPGHEINVSHNVFTSHRYNTQELFALENQGGYGKIADNSMESPLWYVANSNVTIAGNHHDYKPGDMVSNGAAQPHELALELKASSGSTYLPTGHTKFPYEGHQYIQYTTVGTSFSLEATLTNTISGADPHYIIRPNGNEQAVTGSPSTGVISNQNFHFDQEVIKSGNTVSHSLQYNKPGLYGIDIMGFDAQTTGPGADDRNFRATEWKFVPVIVNDPAEQKMLYFNIKDSYYEQNGTTITDVKKQAFLNGTMIWEEDIAQGGDGWEYVKVNLNGNLPGTATPIKGLIKTDGSINYISFGIFMPDEVDATVLKGLFVWVDDVYLKRMGSAAGDNLILDGSVEISKAVGGLPTVSNNSGYWFQNGIYSWSAAPCPFSTDVSINSVERKSGEYSIELSVPQTTCLSYKTDNGKVVAEAGISFDFTDFFDCLEYTTSPLNYFSLTCNPCQTQTITGKNKISQDIVIDNQQIVTFSNCAMAIEPGVKILVKNGGTLIINDSHLFSCEEMWQGIVVEPGGTLEINGTSTSQRTKIQNAIVAVHGVGNGASSLVPKINVTLTEFDNNLTAITLANDNYSTSIVGQCLFRCSDQMIWKEPHFGAYPEYHILVDEAMAVSIGNTPGALNEFNDVNSGIRVDKSSVNIQKSEFKNLVDYSVSPPGKGIGIVASNTSATPQTIEVDARFSNLRRGIQVSGNFDVNVHDNFNSKYFRDIDDIGIFINSMNYPRDISITDIANFQNCNIGIVLRGNNWNSVNVSGNTFENTNFVETTTGSFHNTAITCQSPIATTISSFTISDNKIYDYRIGIHCRNISGIRIGSPNADISTISATGNEIYVNKMSENQENRGVWVENSTDAQFNDNIIVNTDHNTNASFAAMEMSDVIAGRVRRNSLSGIGVNSGRGMIFRNACDLTYLECNSISDFKLGMQLVDAELPAQGLPPTTPNGNDGEGWKNEWNANMAFTDRVVGNTISNSPIPWYHNGDELSDFSPSENLSNVVRPFKNQSPMADCNIPTLRVWDRDLIYGPIVVDTAMYYINEAANSYLGKKRTYEILKSDTSILTTGRNTDSTFYDFFFEMQNSNLELLTLPENLTFLSLDSLYAANEAINDTNSIEANQKVINTIYLHSIIENATFSQNDTMTLSDLAWQQTAVAGKAVYFARAMLFWEIHENIPELRMTPLGPQSNLTSITSFKFQQLKLFPNPTAHLLFIEKDPILILTRIELQNTMGETIFISNSDINMLQIGWLNSGIYLLKAYDTDGNFWHSSFVKID